MRVLSLLAGGVLLFALIGCGSSSTTEKGYSKDDFSKRPPPPGYGPPTGAAPGGPEGSTTKTEAK